VAWALEGMLLTVFSRNRLTWLLASRASRVLFGWIPKLDRWLLRLPGAQDSACGTAFLGTKRTTPVADREIVLEYSGACPTPPAP
jgi:hypothetical protein